MSEVYRNTPSADELNAARVELEKSGKTDYPVASKILENPSCLIMHGDDNARDRLIDDLLNCVLLQYPGSSVAMLDTFTDTLYDHHYHPCVSLYAIEKFETLPEFHALRKIVDSRMQQAKNVEGHVYPGNPLFVLTAESYLYTNAENSDLMADLMHMIVCARQSQVRVLCFNRPMPQGTDGFSTFASFAFLYGAVRKRYYEFIPLEYRNALSEGTLYLHGRDETRSGVFPF